MMRRKKQTDLERARDFKNRLIGEAGDSPVLRAIAALIGTGVMAQVAVEEQIRKKEATP